MTRPGLVVKDRIPLDRVRKAMARGMRTTVETLAISQVSREVDLTRLQSWQQEQEDQGTKYSLNTLLMAATARTLPAYPWLNAELVGSEIIVYQPVNLGMAVSTSQGLVVCVIPGADQLSLDQMERRAELLAIRARNGKLSLQDIESGTFTVSNLGMYGVDSGLALPRPPESAILLFGAVRPRAVVMEGQVQAGETCWACLTYDHRFIDGAMGAAFLDGVSWLLAEPERLPG